jgi:hypothetical protein
MLSQSRLGDAKAARHGKAGPVHPDKAHRFWANLGFIDRLPAIQRYDPGMGH